MNRVLVLCVVLILNRWPSLLHPTVVFLGYFQIVMKVIIYYRSFHGNKFLLISFSCIYICITNYCWYFISNSSLAGCPKGYVERQGDVPGTGYKGSLPLTTEQCAQRCNDEKKCLSFETNPSEKKCHLNDVANPTVPKYPKYDYCIKLGTSIYPKKSYFIY